MDKDTVVFDTPAAPNRNTLNWVLRTVAVLLVVASTVLSVIILSPPEPAVNFEDITSTDEIKEDAVYLITDLKASGIFMYMGDADQKGTIRKSGTGVFIEKEYVHAYHVMAMARIKGGELCVMVFSVKKSDGEIFDLIAENDIKENAAGDPGNSVKVSVYAKAKKLRGDADKAFRDSMEKHSSTPGIDTVKWVFCEMEYYADGAEDYEKVASAEKREYLKLSLALLPVALFLFVFSLFSPKRSVSQGIEESIQEELNGNDEDGPITQ